MTDRAVWSGKAGHFAEDLAVAQSQLGKPREGYWSQYRNRRSAKRAMTALKQTVPMTLRNYNAATQSVLQMSQVLRRTRRRQVFGLWLRIVVASVWAFLRRYGWVLAALAFVAALGAAVVYWMPYLTSLLSAAAPPATPLPDTRP